MVDEVAPWDSPAPAAPAAEVAPWDSPAPGADTGSGDPTAYATKLASITDPKAAGDAARAYNPTGEVGFHPLEAVRTLGSIAAQAASQAGQSIVNIGSKLVGADPKAVSQKLGLGSPNDLLTPDAASLEQGVAQSTPIQAAGKAVNAVDTAIGNVSPAAQSVVRQAASDVGDIANVAGVAGLARGALAKGAASVAEGEPVVAAAKAAAAPADPLDEVLQRPSPAPKAAPAAVETATAPKPDAAPSASAAPPDAAAPATEPPATGQFTRTAPTDPDARAAILKDAGVAETRASALSGDVKDTADDYTTGLMSNKDPNGKRMGDVLGAERQALQTHFDGLIQDAGAPAGMGQADLYARGSDMAATPTAFRDYIDASMKGAYDTTRARYGDTPFPIDPVEQKLQEMHPDFMASQQGQALWNGIQTHFKANGLVPKNAIDMALNPSTVSQAEDFRKFLNRNWSPQTAHIIGPVKDSLDDAVTQAAGSDVYSAARALRTFRANTFDDPKGISSLLDSPDGIESNRPQKLENIPKFVEGMGADQFQHYVNTLKQASVESPDLNPLAKKSLAAVRAQFANGAKAAGDSTAHMWNAKAVTDYLSKHEMQMGQVFTPEEMARFKTGNDAGNILNVDRRYKGAAIQGNQLMQMGLKGAAHAATGAGFGLGHAPGAIVGHLVGKGAEKASAALSKAAIEKRIVQL